MFDLNKITRANIQKLKSYSSARAEFSGSNGVFLDANENPYGTLNRYPDPYQRELKQLINSYKGLDTQNVFVGNGRDEIIDIISFGADRKEEGKEDGADIHFTQCP